MFLNELKIQLKVIKKIVLVGILVLWIFEAEAQYARLPKQDSIQPITNTIFKTNPLAILWGPIPFTAEYRLVMESLVLPNQSILLGGSYLGKSVFLTMLEISDSALQYQSKSLFSGYGVQFEYRFYFHKKSANQWGNYIAAHIAYSRAKLYDDYYGKQGFYNEFRYINYGLVAGNQKVIFNSALDLWLGLGYKYNRSYWVEPTKIEEDEGFGLSLLPHMKLYFGFSIGIAK